MNQTTITRINMLGYEVIEGDDNTYLVAVIPNLIVVGYLLDILFCADQSLQCCVYLDPGQESREYAIAIS